MGILIGMDEAGYGPNLGPLVVGTTVWNVPDAPKETDLWSALGSAVTENAPKDGDARLHVADSKDVYTPSRGIVALETTVLSALRTIGLRPQSFSELHRELIGGTPESEPWFESSDVRLPLEADETEIQRSAELLQQSFDNSGVRLTTVRCDVVLTKRFNHLVRDADSKGIALSRTSVRLLRSVWDPDETDRALVIADKHGGRNRYDELLEEAVDDRMIFRVQESRERSVYRVNRSEIVFRTRAEQHLQVALASMVAKYVREVSMELFNQYWCDHIPGLKPTRGYPVDATRFRDEIAKTAAALGLPEDAWWRSR